jgi:hypothetical protein
MECNTKTVGCNTNPVGCSANPVGFLLFPLESPYRPSTGFTPTTFHRSAVL